MGEKMDKLNADKILDAASELERQSRLFLSSLAAQGWLDDELRRGTELVAYCREVEKTLQSELDQLTGSK